MMQNEGSEDQIGASLAIYLLNQLHVLKIRLPEAHVAMPSSFEALCAPGQSGSAAVYGDDPTAEGGEYIQKLPLAAAHIPREPTREKRREGEGPHRLVLSSPYKTPLTPT